jgi:hypothetical protein
MLVTSTNEQHLALFQTEVTDIDIGRHIDASQVTDVYTAVSIG